MQTIHVLYSAPIPIGHKVRVVWYDQVARHPRAHAEPWIQDLETGVEYGPAWLYLPDVSADMVSNAKDVDRPAPGSTATKELIGVVQRCVVVTLRPKFERQQWHVQTRLDLVPPPPETPFR